MVDIVDPSRVEGVIRLTVSVDEICFANGDLDPHAHARIHCRAMVRIVSVSDGAPRGTRGHALVPGARALEAGERIDL